MMMHRTELAAQALRTRCKTLSAVDRQILILANGKHSLEDLLAMLGAKARGNMVALQARGLLRQMALPLGASLAGSALAGFLPVATPVPTMPNVSGPKRSRAAAKMYMLDMLGMIRSPESASLRVLLQTAQDDQDLALALCAALLFMRSQSSAAYADKAAQQLQAITPLEILQQLDPQCLLAPC